MENLRVNTAFASAPTIVEIVRECDSAWLSAQRMAHNGADDATIYAQLVNEHENLNKTYPVILASMAAGAYDAHAVTKFFKYVADHPWHDEDEFLDTQTVYSAYLCRASARPGVHPSASDVATVRAQMRAALIDNKKRTKEQVEEMQRQADEINKKRAIARAEDLRRALPLARNDCSITVTFDDTQ
jgi:hypothetical protein